MADMLKFVTTPKATPQKRTADERRRDFQEIYDRFVAAEAEKQASRCSQCGVPFCQSGCPLGNNIPDWLMLAAEGDLDGAYDAASATSALPEICGRICPQDRLCEGACVIEQSGHGTVTIGAVESYITEEAWRSGYIKPIEPRADRPQTVGIIGAGPAGLAAADRLREAGYGVTIYDRYDRAGGLLTYGIPGFKLEKPVVQRRTDRLAVSGVVFRQEMEVGADIAFDDVRARHDAVLLATGVYKARSLDVPGVHRDVPGLVQALDYLTASNRRGFGDTLTPAADLATSAKGRRVIVIGGGDTAMDCVRTAVRQGAESVTCLYRRDRENMPGSAREVLHAEEEGVVFQWLVSPQAILADTDGAQGVRAVKMALGAPDTSGRRRPEPLPGTEHDLSADLIILALGFDPEDLPHLFECEALPVSPSGTVRVQPESFMTAMPGVFAAGDIVRGASLVVWAVHDGQKAAAGIHRYIQAAAQHTDATSAAPMAIQAEPA